MKVLVTGATGRVGANVVGRLISAGADVRAIVRPDSRRSEKLVSFPEVEVCEGALNDQEAIDRACHGVTHLLHLAAQMTIDDCPIDEFYDVNSFSTLRLLEGVLRRAPRLERFVLASTDSVYCPGAPSTIPLTENASLEPADYYGTSKLLGEIILRNRATQFGIPFSILRYGTILSPEEAHNLYRLGFLRGWLGAQQNRGRLSTLWPLFEGQPNLTAMIDEAAGHAPAETAAGFVGPDGPWTLSAVDVRDAAMAACLALMEPGAAGRVFNIVGAKPIAADEGAAAVAEMFGVPQLLVRLPFTWRLELSIAAAREHLGYEPVHDYRSTLRAAASGLASTADYIPAAEGNAGVFGKLSDGSVLI